MNDEAVTRYSTAKGYIESAKMIFLSPHNIGGQQVLTVLSMNLLVGFALELMLKAWLLQQGNLSKDVRGLGHRVADLHALAKAEGLPRIDSLDEVVAAIAPGHEDFTYRYIEAGDQVNLLVWENVFRVLDELDLTVDAHVGASQSKGLQPGH